MTDPTAAEAAYTYVLDERVRLLAVDDDPILREFATVYLATPSAEVETAASGEEGIEKLQQGHYDLMLIDLDMPGIGGIEAIRRVRADPRLRLLPIIVVTGREDIVSIDRAFDAGATSFVCKPVNWRLLSYQVRYVLRAQKLITAA
ncbi:response regulator [Methylobrevis albus]|uniref:Response regulator n=1 Tax=Methylobrevis albus TaxID=2793297 RepID=A0A931MZ57_9HYPH|nr:response regulator [Methylobrevis albus]MBH0239137.1 response regulator [Methylobrevis albus]